MITGNLPPNSSFIVFSQSIFLSSLDRHDTRAWSAHKKTIYDFRGHPTSVAGFVSACKGPVLWVEFP